MQPRARGEFKYRSERLERLGQEIGGCGSHRTLLGFSSRSKYPGSGRPGHWHCLKQGRHEVVREEKLDC